MIISPLKKISLVFLTFSAIDHPIQAMEQKKKYDPKSTAQTKKIETKSTDDEVILVLANLIDKNVKKNTKKLKPPKNLFDAFVHLKGLFSKLEVAVSDKDLSSIQYKGFSLRDTFIITENSTAQKLFFDAIKLVLKYNSKAIKLIDYFIKELARKVTEKTKERYIDLINQLPKPVSEHIKHEFIFNYGWYLLLQNQSKYNNKVVIDRILALDSYKIAMAQNAIIKIINFQHANNKSEDDKAFTEVTETLDLLGHDAPISAFAYNKSNILASGADDSTIKIWDITTGEPLQTLHGHTNAISELTFLNDTLLVSQSKDSVKIWDITTGKYIIEHTYNKSDPKKIYYLSRNNRNALHDRKTNKIYTIIGNNNAPLWLKEKEFTDNTGEILKNKIAISFEYGNIEYEDLKSAQCGRIPYANPKKVILVNDNLLASYTDKGSTIQTWGINRDLSFTSCFFHQSPTKTLKKHTRPITDLVVLNENTLVSASLFHGDGRVIVWDVATGKPLAILVGFETNSKKSGLDSANNTFFLWRGNRITYFSLPTFEKTINYLAQKNSKQISKLAEESEWELIN